MKLEKETYYLKKKLDELAVAEEETQKIEKKIAATESSV